MQLVSWHRVYFCPFHFSPWSHGLGAPSVSRSDLIAAPTHSNDMGARPPLPEPQRRALFVFCLWWGFIAEPGSKAYRPKSHFLVELVQSVLSWFGLQAKRGAPFLIPLSDVLRRSGHFRYVSCPVVDS